MSDSRAKALSDAALRCRNRRNHPIPDLFDALLGVVGVEKRVVAGVTELRSTCLTRGCGVIVVDRYNSVGHKIHHALIYPKDDEGNQLYLLPPGDGRLDPDDVRAEVFARAKAAERENRKRK
jgi:hypothetical protein